MGEPSLQARVASALAHRLVDEERLDSLRDKYARGEPVDYDVYALSHLALYYWVNYTRVREACRLTALRPSAGEPLEMIDLGVGAGPAAAAIVDYLRDELEFPEPIHLSAVELSDAQVELFQEVTAPHLARRRVEIDVGRELVPEPSASTLVIGSYFLSELDRAERRRQLSTIAEVAGDGWVDLLIIDDEQSMVFTEMDGLASWPTRHELGPRRFEVPEPLFSRWTVRKSYSLVGLLCRSAPWERGTIHPALESYRLAWEAHRPSILRALFLDDATYEIEPGRVLRGLDEIVRYWEHNEARQKQVRFAVEQWAEKGAVVLADWSAQFSRTDLNRDMRLSGSMRLELSQQKIERFAEYFTKTLSDPR